MFWEIYSTARNVKVSHELDGISQETKIKKCSPFFLELYLLVEDYFLSNYFHSLKKFENYFSKIFCLAVQETQQA